MENDITQKAIDRIAREGIHPESNTRARLRKFAFWVPVIIALLLGSIASAGAFFVLQNSDWDLFGRLGAGFILRSMPYFWLIFLAIFVLLGEFSYGKTTIGYRYNIAQVTIVYVISTALLGGVFLVGGMDRVFGRAMFVRGALPNMMFNQVSIWSHPEQGLLSGTIHDVGESSFGLTDFSNNEWHVAIGHTFVGGRVQIKEGESVKVVGVASGTVFVAEQIRPWMGAGMMNQQGANHTRGGMMGQGAYTSGGSGMMR